MFGVITQLLVRDEMVQLMQIWLIEIIDCQNRGGTAKIVDALVAQVFQSWTVMAS